jgi:hypothetical protein
LNLKEEASEDDNENDSTIGCKITAIKPDRFLFSKAMAGEGHHH